MPGPIPARRAISLSETSGPASRLVDAIVAHGGVEAIRVRAQLSASRRGG
ncbi:hypothetical protein [Actinomadura atramentaria]|nr:hypothetical protein [Actinomadura atramentaria]